MPLPDAEPKTPTEAPLPEYKHPARGGAQVWLILVVSVITVALVSLCSPHLHGAAMHRVSGACLAALAMGATIPLIVFLATSFGGLVGARPVARARPLGHALGATAISTLVAGVLVGLAGEVESLALYLLALASLPIFWNYAVPRIVLTRYLKDSPLRRLGTPPTGRLFLIVGTIHLVVFSAVSLALGLIHMAYFDPAYVGGRRIADWQETLFFGGPLVAMQATVAVIILFRVLRGHRGALAAQSASEALT